MSSPKKSKKKKSEVTSQTEVADKTPDVPPIAPPPSLTAAGFRYAGSTAAADALGINAKRQGLDSLRISMRK